MLPVEVPGDWSATVTNFPIPDVSITASNMRGEAKSEKLSSVPIDEKFLLGKKLNEVTTVLIVTVGRLKKEAP